MRGITLRLYVRIQQVLARLGLKLPGKIMYIGGSDTLPPPLARDEEAELIARMDGGDESVKSQLIERNLRLVVYIARRFENTGINIEDLISIGTIGLIKAVSTYKPAKNIKLATYASRCIENEILMYLRKTANLKSEVSFDEPLNTDWDGNELLLSDILGTENDLVMKPIEDDVDRQLLTNALEKLSERERLIITLRFGLDGRQERTQKEVADQLGISQSYISRLEKRIISRLKKEILRLDVGQRAGRALKSLTNLFWKLGHDQRVGHVTHVLEERFRHRSVEINAVPIALVGIKAGDHVRVFGAEGLGQAGVAFEDHHSLSGVRLVFRTGRTDRSEHFAAYQIAFPLPFHFEIPLRTRLRQQIAVQPGIVCHKKSSLRSPSKTVQR